MYIPEHYEYGQDIADSMDKMKHVDLEKHKPKMPTKTVKTTGTDGTEETKEVEKKEDELSFIEKDVLKREVNNYVNRLAKYKDNKNRIYSLTLRQCTT